MSDVVVLAGLVEEVGNIYFVYNQLLSSEPHKGKLVAVGYYLVDNLHFKIK